ncbi:MAG: hypothetical protein CVV05_01365 [Gammaproteobacteria bacterium HGW-Gammaproteobacteria-1]|jgi:hypothetical protein|nr:MAG: hypothetical protein CVV05_01365 [Gammaproteobacteria bacterium HGW-Gammaproteobacteria-1]
MSMEYIRKTYGVPAKRGGEVRVMLDGSDGIPGTITGSRGQYLRIRIAGRRRPGLYHPTHALEYMTPSTRREFLQGCDA